MSLRAFLPSPPLAGERSAVCIPLARSREQFGSADPDASDVSRYLVSVYWATLEMPFRKRSAQPVR